MNSSTPIPPDIDDNPSHEDLEAYCAARGSPVVDAMRQWLTGVEPVPNLQNLIDRFGEGFRSYRRAWRFDVSIGEIIAFNKERPRFIEEFGFPIPTEEALDAVARYSPLVEVGAGAGAWAKLLTDRGVDLIATDACLEQFSFEIGRHYHSLPMQGKTAIRRWPNRNVFCSWPSFEHTWLRQAAKAMRPGRALIVIREDATADERTWDYVEAAFREVEEPIELPSWHYIHDQLEIFVKKGRR